MKTDKIVQSSAPNHLQNDKITEVFYDKNNCYFMYLGLCFDM